MPDLVIHNPEPALVEELTALAAREGISVEEEHHRLLQRALESERTSSESPPPEYAGLNFKELLLAMPNVGRDEDFVMPRHPPRKVDI